ncbi:MAG: 23S rRNA (guanosine(2251)-2'-O)-methyltransferase RlmB [Pseudomonadota bacterium]
MPKKPAWAIEKDRARKPGQASASDRFWLFGLHAVRDALCNHDRVKHRLIVTKNASDRLAPEILATGMTPEISDPRRFSAPIDTQSVHQGVALEVEPLDWGSVSERCAPGTSNPLVLALDRVTDPHNVGAILRSAEVFGACAVVAPYRHSSPETGALAKAASGALERQPYLRVPNLARAMGALHDMGYYVLGLDGSGEITLEEGVKFGAEQPLVLVLGSEGEGLRQLTRSLCDEIVQIPASSAFGSLNVSNAAAVALYAARGRH